MKWYNGDDTNAECILQQLFSKSKNAMIRTSFGNM
jgi:hypothetical protein